jgi:hypothetical protein
MVPPGLKVEFRSYEDLKIRDSHALVTIRPQDTDDPEQCLVIDPWPSGQYEKPEVVALKDYVYAEK